MQKIPFTRFIKLLSEHESARICRQVIKGSEYEPLDADLDEALKASGPINFRKVEHTQSNAIRFTGGSWLMFKTPAHVHRKCYAGVCDEHQYLVSVEYREAYKNGFGTPIAEQNTVLIYQLRS